MTPVSAVVQPVPQNHGFDPGHALATMVAGPDYPCLGARSVFNTDRATVVTFEQLAGPATAAGLLTALQRFARTVDPDEGFASFVAAFRGPVIRDERHFEQLLWHQLQQLHDLDPHEWNREVSADPDDPHFAFSVAGTAYFVVGLHPQASRLARRTPAPVLVFNLHAQFEQLRESERFPRMRDRIRARDRELQGSINPMVADHGAASEARQYSGRPVGDQWHAPFTPHDTEPA